MIVYDKEQKQIVIPNGLGNVNIVINQGGECPECPDCPDCPECPEVTTYPTIKDIYNTEDTTTEVYFKATVAVCLQNGSNYRMIVTDHTGAFYIDTNQPYDVGDECIFTGVVRKYSGTNIRFMNRPVVEVLSKNNYVVMPTDAVELTNVSDLYTNLNEYGNAEMKYLYYEGFVERIDSGGNIRITTPESVSERGEINLRGSKEEWRSNLVVGDYVRVYMFTATSDGWFVPTDLIKLGLESGDCPELGEITITENGTYEGAYDRVIVDVPQEGGGDCPDCNLEDKSVDPTVADVDGGWIYIYPSEGYVGMSRTLVNTGNLQQNWYDDGYNQGYQDGQENCEGGGETSCTLEPLTVRENGFYEPKPQEFGYLNVNKNSAFDTGVKLVDSSIIEIYFNTGDNDSNIPTLIGCEDSDWTNTTFAVRWFSGNLSVKLGTQEIGIPMSAEDIYSKLHKLKFGRYEGVWLDDNYIGSFDNTEWVISQNTIFIGAMHNTTNGDANGVFRPWNGYLSNVKIYGEKNSEVRDFTFNCGDFGKWGEYETDGNILPNIMGDGGAIFNCCKQYGDKPFDGYSSVDVNIDVEPYKEDGRNEVRNNLKSIEITENGTYSTNDQILVKSLRYNGGYETDTISTYDINRIEVTFKADTSESINGQGQPFILGGSMWGLTESGENNKAARAIQYAVGRIVGYWEGKWTDATGCMDGEWLTIILDENGMSVKYPNYDYEQYFGYTHNNGNVNSGGDIFPFIIGGQGQRADGENGNYTSSLIEDSQFRGLIKEIKINTNSMGEITYIPKNWGNGVWDRKVENTGEYLSALEPTEGEILFNEEWQKKYGEGWNEIIVNVSGSIGTLNYQEISYSDYLALGDNVDDNTIYLMDR